MYLIYGTRAGKSLWLCYREHFAYSCQREGLPCALPSNWGRVKDLMSFCYAGVKEACIAALAPKGNRFDSLVLTAIRRALSSKSHIARLVQKEFAFLVPVRNCHWFFSNGYPCAKRPTFFLLFCAALSLIESSSLR